MKIYKAYRTPGYELCLPATAEDGEAMTARVSPGATGEWVRPTVAVVSEEEGRKLKHSDAPDSTTSSKMFFRWKAVTALRSLLEPSGELLPLLSNEGEGAIWMYNATRFVDGLDMERSCYRTLRSSGQINGITSHVFKSHVVEGLSIFRLVGLRLSPIFLGEDFVKTWKSANLVGLDFEEIWSS